MRVKKPKGLASTAGLIRLAGHTAMGIAMGLGFGLLLIVVNPSGVATLIENSGNPVRSVFMATLVLTFGIGATLTGAIFMMTEEAPRP